MADPFTGRRWWIVGASDGLGAALARAMDAEGATLVLSARRAAVLTDLASGLRAAEVVAMDVTDAASVAAAVGQVGPVDAILYCAGAYEPMTAPDWQPEEAVRIAEVNFIGALRVLGRVVPAMARRGSGRVVLIGSLAGFAGLPGAIGYGASKAALMHLAENLRADLKGTGVVVQRANPGFIRTRLTAKNDFSMPQLMTPEDAAGHVMAAIRSGRFSTSFPRPFAWVFSVGGLLPTTLFQRLVARG